MFIERDPTATPSFAGTLTAPIGPALQFRPYPPRDRLSFNPFTNRSTHHDTLRLSGTAQGSYLRRPAG